MPKILLSSAIKAYRTLRGMRQQDLARELGCSRSLVAAWENGLSIPTTTMLRKISKVLKVPMKDLLPETGRLNITAED